MGEMGLGHHQYIAVRHHDTDHEHIHIIASRIGLDGGLYLGKWDAKRAIKLTADLEQRHGLTITKGLEDGPAPVATPTRKEVEMSLRTGDAPPRVVLQQIVDAALSEPGSVFDFIDRLEAAGVGVKANVASTGKMNGFSFMFAGVPFKASDLGKAYGWKSLQARGLNMSKIEMVRRLSHEQTEMPRQSVRSTTEAQSRLIETLDRLATDQNSLTLEYRAAVASLIETLTTSAQAAEQMISGAHQEAQSVLLSSVAAVSKAEKAAQKAEAIMVSAQASMAEQSKTLADQSKALSRLISQQTALTKSLRICAVVVALGTVLVVGSLVWRVMRPV